jgi:hypothetical protein
MNGFVKRIHLAKQTPFMMHVNDHQFAVIGLTDPSVIGLKVENTVPETEDGAAM